jgi:hypothetical protein
MLEEEEAAALTRTLGERVVKYASGEIKGEGDEAINMAEGVSALGLYVEALQRSSADPRSVLLPTLLRFGLAKKEPEKKPPPKEVKAPAKPAAPAPAAPRKEAAPIPKAETQAATPAAEPAPGPEAAAAVAEPAAEPAMIALDFSSTAAAEPAAAEIREQESESADDSQGAETDELERLRESEAKLKAQIEERDRRIRTLQGQLVALHSEAKKVAKLETDLRAAREALAKVVRKTK